LPAQAADDSTTPTSSPGATADPDAPAAVPLDDVISTDGVGTQSLGPGGFEVYSIYYGTCLDANPSAWWQDPGKPWLWSCNRTFPQQWWYFQPFDNGRFALRTVGAPYGPGKCLDAAYVPGFQGGWRISVWTCNGLDYQRWYLAYANGVDQWAGYLLVNDKYGLCLDVPHNDGPRNGGIVTLYQCHRDWNQRWTLIRRV
jgi:Ricin-type beta-trefoil lectin domain